MILERFPEIQKLSVEERLQLHRELSDTLFIDEPVTDPNILAILEHRRAEYLKDPSLARPWPEVRERIFGKSEPKVAE